MYRRKYPVLSSTRKLGLTGRQMSGLLYLLDVYEALMGASAVAAVSILRYALAAAFPLFINPSELALFWNHFLTGKNLTYMCLISV